jgi:hypothetical protein
LLGTTVHGSGTPEPRQWEQWLQHRGLGCQCTLSAAYIQRCKYWLGAVSFTTYPLGSVVMARSANSSTTSSRATSKLTISHSRALHMIYRMVSRRFVPLCHHYGNTLLSFHNHLRQTCCATVSRWRVCWNANKKTSTFAQPAQGLSYLSSTNW